MSDTRGLLLAVDGNSLINRAYYGLGRNVRMSGPGGQPTGAVHTFLTMLLKQLDALDPSHILVCFDRPEPTFRHEAYADYKATRTGMPDDLAIQMPILKACLEALGIAQAELPGYEADDLLGTSSRIASEAGLETVLLSGDKDSFQLIDEQVVVLVPGASAARGDERYDREQFRARYGIEPKQFIDVKAIMGDSSDNIPGVRGIGEKGALQLIGDYGDLDGVYAHLDELRPAQRKRLVEQEEMARFSRELATIEREVPYDFELEALERPNFEEAPAYEVFQAYGLSQLIQRLKLRPGLGGASALTRAALEGLKPEEEVADGEPDALEALRDSRMPETLTATWLAPDAARAQLLRDAAREEGRLAILVEWRDDGFARPSGAGTLAWSDGEAYYLAALAADGDGDEAEGEGAGRAFLVELLDGLYEAQAALTGFGAKQWLRLAGCPVRFDLIDLQVLAYLLSIHEGAATALELWRRLSQGEATAQLQFEARPQNRAGGRRGGRARVARRRCVRRVSWSTSSGPSNSSSAPSRAPSRPRASSAWRRRTAP